jgi:hypothetical protein
MVRLCLFQRLLSIEDILDHEEFKKTFPDDYVFTLDSILADRLGANVRNDVAHGLMDDGRSNSHEAAYLWWFALRLLLAVGPNPLDNVAPRAQADGSIERASWGMGKAQRPKARTAGSLLAVRRAVPGVNVSIAGYGRTGSCFKIQSGSLSPLYSGGMMLPQLPG